MERTEFSGAGSKENVMTVKRLSIDMNVIPRYFGMSYPCAQDIIAYVRHKDRYPDPNQIVVIETESSPVEMERLKDNKIFYSGPQGNDKDINIYVGSNKISLPVFVEDMDPESHSCGLDAVCDRIVMEYGIDDFGLLLCGTRKDLELLTRAWDYMTRVSNYGCIVPDFVIEEASKDKSAIDIKPVVDKLNELLPQNKLTHTALMKEVEALSQQVKDKLAAGEEVRIMSSARVHDKYTRQIMLYLSVHCGISPKYLKSYLDSYIDGRVAYDYKRMSLYERFMWLKNLPEAFGYINHRLSFYCFCSLEDEALFSSTKAPDTMEIALPNGQTGKLTKEIAARLYPEPLYAIYVDMTGQRSNIVFSTDDKEVTKDLDPIIKGYLGAFKYANYGDAMNFIDFRTMFKNSKEHFPAQEVIDPMKRSIQKAGVEDPDRLVDKQWTQIFVKFADEVGKRYGDKIYPSVKNCILLPVYGSGVLLLYCPGSLGINCMMKSNYFDKDIQLIGEESFHQLIDIRTLLALISSEPGYGDAADDRETGKKRFDLVMSKPYSNLPPWIDEEVILTLNTIQAYHTELSYYDRFLRGTVNILPIVTSEDDKLYDGKYRVLFDRMNYVDLMNADESDGALSGINCFGTSTDAINPKPAIQVTIECAKGDEHIWQNL